MRYGLLGRSLPHSHSPWIHRAFGNGDYGLFEIPPEELPAFMARRDFQGLNVTLPYKQAVLPYLDALSDTARHCGGVNTILRREDGTLYGDNTDAAGLEGLLDKLGISLRGQKVLILGTGGTANCARYVVSQKGGIPVLISRRGENDYAHLQRHRDAALLINATPVGMMPDVELSPVDLARLPGLLGVVDVIYNPRRTRLLQQAMELGIPCIGGLRMLVWQAAASHQLFTGKELSSEIVDRVIRELNRRTLSVALIGMPGSGKTTLGGLLARDMGRPFRDTDRLMEAESGCTIPEIFARDGEAAFRQLERDMLQRETLSGGQVLAAGGGAVLRQDNRRAIRQNAVVVWLQRSPELLATEGRPLSVSLSALQRMEEERTPLYQACADLILPNNGTIAEGLAALKEALHEYLGD